MLLDEGPSSILGLPQRRGSELHYVYTRSTGTLFNEVLPFDYIASPNGLSSEQMEQDATTASLMAHSGTVNSFAGLSIRRLLVYADIMHACWANGVEIGELDSGYWSTLGRAWNTGTAAVEYKEVHFLDAEGQDLHTYK